jgi:hypothetical protein
VRIGAEFRAGNFFIAESFAANYFRAEVGRELTAKKGNQKSL